MANLRVLKTDSTKESNGVWKEYNSTGVEFLIARAGSDKFDRDVRELRKTHKITSNSTEEERRRAIAPAIADHILLAWKNLQGDDDVELKPTREMKISILSDPDCKDLVDWILFQASSIDNFRAEQIESIKGN